jgi:hypothetical protein
LALAAVLIVHRVIRGIGSQPPYRLVFVDKSKNPGFLRRPESVTAPQGWLLEGKGWGRERNW